MARQLLEAGKREIKVEARRMAPVIEYDWIEQICTMRISLNIRESGMYSLVLFGKQEYPDHKLDVFRHPRMTQDPVSVVDQATGSARS